MVVHIAADSLLSENHFWVLGKVFIDHHGAIRRVNRSSVGPSLAARGFAWEPLAQENNVRHHAGARIVFKCSGWQANSPQQVGTFRQVLACLVGLLVHGALAGDEHLNATGPHQVDALGKEEVMQHEPFFRVLGISEYLGLAKWRVSHVHIKEVFGVLSLDEVAMNHVLLWRQQLCNQGGGAVKLNPGVAGLRANGVRHQHGKRANAHPRLKHLAALKSHAIQCAPYRANNAFAGVVGVLTGLQYGLLPLAR